MIGQRLRLVLLAVVIVSGCLVLFYRLWFLQIESQEEYINKQPVTATARQRVPGVRGRILDTNGVEFAKNETNLEICLDFAAVEAAWKEREKAKPRKERRKIPTFEYGPRKEETTDIIALLNEMVFPELDRLKLYRVPATEAEKEKQKRAIILSYVSHKGVIPFPYEKNLLQSNEEDFKRFTAYAENAPSIPGLTISERPKRRYPLKAMAGHLIGYIQENRDVLPPEEKKAQDKESAEAIAAGQPRKQFFNEADDFGYAGLEKSQEEKLRGKPGERIWLKNEHGRLTDEIREMRRDPLPGADVFLTLDARIQFLAEMALRDAKAGRAAAVVLDPQTFKVKALASIPSYDPSIFLPPKQNDAINDLYASQPPAVLPLALRAETPGSAFKLMTALAASIGDVGTPSFTCNGFMQYGSKAIKCMGTHGTLGMADAIKKSCNCYFMQLGVRAKIEHLWEVSRYFNFGGQDFAGNSGVEVPDLENNGRIYLDTRISRQAATALISMGQGGASASPLQLCMLAAALGNGGRVYQPTLIDHYEEYQYDRDGRRQKVITEFKPKLLADLLKKGVKKRDFDIMREGMRLVVNDPGGTGKAAKSAMCIVAGKTSTAQRPRNGQQEDRVWFMAWAPYENPTVAVAVMVINAKSGGRVAAPIARRIIEQTLGVQAGTYNVKVTPLDPAKGSFDRLEENPFPGENLPAEDPDVAEGTEEDPEETATPAPVQAEPAPPRAKAIPEDDAPILTRQELKPVKFRLKSDAPNPIIPPPQARVDAGPTH